LWKGLQDLQRIAAPNRNRFGLLLALLAVLAAAAGCGSEPSRRVPVGCKAEPAAVERALAQAPGEVRLGGHRLSECFAPGSDPGDEQALALAVLPAAERLGAEARERPRGPAPLRLGFLIGAVQRGAARGRVYAELERRVRQELAGVDTAAPGYVRGLRAGRGHG
jgi:hypothetical protein